MSIKPNLIEIVKQANIFLFLLHQQKCIFGNILKSSFACSRSGYYKGGRQHAPARSPPIIVTPMPRRSMFRDAASIAGGVTVGTTAGHLVGEALTGLFRGRRRDEVMHELPRSYQPGTEPTGPCAYEITQFLQCAVHNENLQACSEYNEALRDCKRRNRL